MHVTDIFPCIAYKVGHGCIAISEETRQWAVKELGHPASEITLIPHGVSMDFAQAISPPQKQAIRQHYHIPENKTVIGLVGSLEYRKGHDLLIQAYENLPGHLRQNAILLFIGSAKSADARQWFQKLWEGLNPQIRANILHIDYTNPMQLYKIMDIFVLPSRQEGFGLTCIEAMLSACCCVRSRTEGADLQIEHQKTGLLFPSNDVQALRNCLEQLLTDPEYRLRLARSGQKKAKQEFVSSVMAQKTYCHYQQLLQQ